MTDDDWSLKGKGIACGPGPQTITVYDDHRIYPDDIIETLRQKLIEDLSEQFPKNQIEIEYLINKRFGLEE